MVVARAVAGIGLVLTLVLRTSHASADTLTRNLRASTGSSGISNWDLKPSAFHVHAGIGTPVGFIGVELEHNFVKYFGVAGGVGYSRGGVQGAIELLVRPFVWRRHGILFVPGVSIGSFDGEELNFPDQTDSPTSRKYRVEPGVWLNIGLGYDYRTDRGFMLRAYSGYGVLMNKDDLRCYSGVMPEGPCEVPVRLVFPYMGVALGHAF